MMTNCDEWCRLECGECKWFNVRADMEGVESTCKRLDHKHLRFAKKIFKSYDCGQFDTNTCADFKPDEKKVPWLYNHWDKVKEQIIPYKSNHAVSLNIDGDTSVKWAVKAIEFYDGTFLNPDGSLRWVYKYYSVPCRTSPSKYKTLYEFPNGITLEHQFAMQYIGGHTKMSLDILQKVLSTGDKYGSALKEILNNYGIVSYDLSEISDEQAIEWLKKKGVDTSDINNNKKDS